MQPLVLTLLFAYFVVVAVATSKKATKKSVKDRNDNRGLTPFLLIDRTDNTCLGPKGFTNCDESALWILTTRVGKSTYSLVSFQHPKEQTCLTRDSFLGVFSSNNLKLGSCGSNHAKSWQWEFVEDYVRLSNGGQCLVRGKNGNKHSVSLQSCKQPGSLVLEYSPTAVHENGFFLKAADGTCFDGNKFRACAGSGSDKLLWGLGVKYTWGGGASKYLFNYSPMDYSSCMVVKGGKVAVGSCLDKSAMSWGFTPTSLTYKQGSMCLVRKMDDSAAVVPCTQGSEYVVMQVPEVYTQEQLEQYMRANQIAADDRSSTQRANQRKSSYA